MTKKKGTKKETHVPKWKMYKGKKYKRITHFQKEVPCNRRDECIPPLFKREHRYHRMWNYKWESYDIDKWSNKQEAIKEAREWSRINIGRSTVVKVGNYYYIYGRKAEEDVPGKMTLDGRKHELINGYMMVAGGKGPWGSYPHKAMAERAAKEWRGRGPHNRARVVEIDGYYHIYSDRSDPKVVENIRRKREGLKYDKSLV